MASSYGGEIFGIKLLYKFSTLSNNSLKNLDSGRFQTLKFTIRQGMTVCVHSKQMATFM
jgi:hypothetical protein